MKRLTEALRVNLIRGIFLVVPIVLVLVIFGKVIVIFRTILGPVVSYLRPENAASEFLIRVLAIVLLAVVCIFAGILAKTKLATQLRDWIEENILSMVPGYSLLKSMGESAIGISSDSTQEVVLVDLEGTWQVGYIMEQVAEEVYCVFIPGAPSSTSGDVIFVRKERLKKLDIPTIKAARISTKLGVGSRDILSAAGEPNKLFAWPEESQ
jgi:uncharacterized membrane protein